MKTDKLPEVTIHTDGSCLGNPGPGGWAAVLRTKNRKKEISGSEPLTTNNRMELTAVINALKALKQRCKITLITDSKYLHDALNKGWLKKWQNNNWQTSAKKPVKNQDLWEALAPLLDRHNCQILWTKGHAGNAGNERCDQLARNEALAVSQHLGDKK